MKCTISKINLLNLSSRNQSIFSYYEHSRALPCSGHAHVLYGKKSNTHIPFLSTNSTPSVCCGNINFIQLYLTRLLNWSFDNLKETIVTPRDALNHKKTSFFLVYTCWGLPPFVSPNNLKSRSHNIRLIKCNVKVHRSR